MQDSQHYYNTKLDIERYSRKTRESSRYSTATKEGLGQDSYRVVQTYSATNYLVRLIK
jgi:hypothetical protein